jgi:ABC-type sugar transport system ATPase subunit
MPESIAINRAELIFDELTAGVDVGAKMEIYKLKSHAAGLSIQCVRLQVSPGVPILC